MTVYEDDAPHVLGSVMTLFLLAVITFGLRVYVRMGKTWGPEDTSMAIGMVSDLFHHHRTAGVLTYRTGRLSNNTLVAQVPFVVLSIACILASLNGVGIHKAHLAQPGREKYTVLGLLYFFLFEVFYCGTIIPIKLSIALMLIRIAQNRKIYVYAQWAIMTLFFIADGGALFYIIFQCKPVSYAWDTSGEGYCLPAQWLTNLYYAVTAVNIATDWVTALLPIPLLWTVRLERSEKLSVAAILGLGIFASLAACIRLAYTINLTNSTDYLFAVSDIVVWGYGEIAVGVFVGCLATLRPLFRKLFRLGSIGSSGPSRSKGPLDASASPFPSNARRTYGQVSGDRSVNGRGHDFEMGHMGVRSDAFKGGASALGHHKSSESSSADARASMSISSESDSIEQILKEASKQGMGNKSIVVSRQVQIAHSKS